MFKGRIERPARVDPQESPDFTMKREQWGKQVSSPPAHQHWISAQTVQKMEDGEFQAADRTFFLSRVVLNAQRASFLVKIALKGERT